MRLELASIQSPVKRELGLVANEVNELLVPEILETSLAEKLFSSAGRQQIHASLLLLTAHSLGKISEEHVSLATGCELFQLATWTHDAVIDDVDIEGWSRERMIIDGDYIFSRGLTLLTSGLDPSSLVASRMIETMAWGELQYVQERLDTSPELHIDMIQDKFGSLFSASCELAALRNHLSEKQLSNLRNYGTRFGTAYKIGDEILTFADMVRRGRVSLPVLACTVRDDRARHLFGQRDAENLMALCSSNGGFKGAQTQISQWSDRALSALSASGIESDPLRDLCIWVTERARE